METTLRPLTLGEILDRTAELYRTNFLLLAGISSVYAGFCWCWDCCKSGRTARVFSHAHEHGPDRGRGCRDSC